jgi:hypothetical protein
VPIQPKQSTAKGPAEWFRGDVFIDAIAQGEEPSRVRVSAVRFTPGARTAWHAHAVGQTLYVTEGRGWCIPAAAPSRSSGPATSSPRQPTSGTGTGPPRPLHDASVDHRSAPGDDRLEADWGEHLTDDEYHHR